MFSYEFIHCLLGFFGICRNKSFEIVLLRVVQGTYRVIDFFFWGGGEGGEFLEVKMTRYPQCNKNTPKEKI